MAVAVAGFIYRRTMLKLAKLPAALLFAAAFFMAADACAKDADEALAMLKEGNARFVSMAMRHPDLTAERRTDTAVNGQKPFAVVLSCSDSRVPVESIFDRGIGDIFVVRVAGNIAVDPGVTGTIDYGAGHLGCPLVVIMAHTDCGAVKLAVSGTRLEGGARLIQKTIAIAAEKVGKEDPGLKGASLINAVAKENAHRVKIDLLLASEELRRLALDGKVKIVTAIYDLNTGVVEWV
jgi:carbonic anhydrase